METGGILQAEVVPIGEVDGEEDVRLSQTTYHETFSPLKDPLLQHILSLAPSIYTPISSQGPRWVPTVALGILMKLFECRPNSSVAFADFDWLPPPDLGTYESSLQLAGDPIVTDMKGNDHLSYLTSPPDALCDILFPTDFGRLAAFAKLAHASIVKSEREIITKSMKQSDFLMQYGADEVKRTTCWSGYSPMINDFGNCSVLAVTKG